jgi:hypothetical protein
MSKRAEQKAALEARMVRGDETAAARLVRMTRAGRSGEGKVREAVLRTRRQFERRKATLEQAVARLEGLRRKCQHSQWAEPVELAEALAFVRGNPPLTRAEVAAKGGRVTAAESPAKAAALEQLKKVRKGERLHPCPAKVGAALVAARVMLDGPGAPRGPVMPLGTSCKAFARVLGVSDRTVRRWLSGEDVPDPKWHRDVLEWVAGMRKRAAVLDAG